MVLSWASRCVVIVVITSLLRKCPEEKKFRKVGVVWRLLSRVTAHCLYCTDQMARWVNVMEQSIQKVIC